MDKLYVIALDPMRQDCPGVIQEISLNKPSTWLFILPSHHSIAPLFSYYG